MKMTNKYLMAAITAIFITLTGCNRAGLYEQTMPYTIDAADKVSITFVSESNLLVRRGVFFISADGIPSPEAGTTYSSIEIPANTGKNIKVRAWYRETIARQQTGTIDHVNIDEEEYFDLPALEAGSYTISYLMDKVMDKRNKRMELRDTSGNIIHTVKME